MAALSDRDRLSDLLSESYSATHGGWGPVADKLLAAGVTLPPAPVDPAWFEEATKVMDTTSSRAFSTYGPAYWKAHLRALLAAGYRIVPPTQDRVSVTERAVRVLRTEVPRVGHDADNIAAALYDAGMLVEGDGR